MTAVIVTDRDNGRYEGTMIAVQLFSENPRQSTIVTIPRPTPAGPEQSGR